MVNLKKKLRSFLFPDILRSLSVPLRYALGVGALQKKRCSFSRQGLRRPFFCPQRCTGCKLCVKICPAAAVRVRTVFGQDAKPDVTFYLSEDRCVSCGLCIEACPESALTLKGK